MQNFFTGYRLHRVQIVYLLSLYGFFIVSKTEIKLGIQGSLVAMFFNCLDDETMMKVEVADASVDRDWWDLSVRHFLSFFPGKRFQYP